MKKLSINIQLIMALLMSTAAIVFASENSISINIGSILNNSGNDAYSNSEYWNSFYKGNTGNLIDNNGALTTCLIKSNAIKTIKENGTYLASGNANLTLTFELVPYPVYDIIVYSNKEITMTANNKTKTVSPEKGYVVYSSLDKLNAELVFEGELGPQKIQIIESKGEVTKGKVQEPNETISVYPTIVTDNINIKISNAPEGEYQIQLISVEGRVVRSEKHLKVEDIKTIIMNVGEMVPGSYVISINGNGNIVNKKIQLK